jgi:hypothetical protein
MKLYKFINDYLISKLFSFSFPPAVPEYYISAPIYPELIRLFYIYSFPLSYKLSKLIRLFILICLINLFISSS